MLSQPVLDHWLPSHLAEPLAVTGRAMLQANFGGDILSRRRQLPVFQLTLLSPLWSISFTLYTRITCPAGITIINGDTYD
jgi:hypothetical protein